ncbi:MAG: toluene tolerance protein [Proteobacteria bacterium]|nr:toluene tolerance protein [Pseudomonadota bacterium]
MEFSVFSRRRMVGLTLAAALFAAGPAVAAPSGGAPSGGAPSGGTTSGAGVAQAPLVPIRALDAALLDIMRAGKTAPFQKRFDMLAPAVDRAFDLPHILRVSVGPGWSELSPTLQASLLDAFRRYTVASYVDNFDSFDGQHFDLQSDTRALPDGEQVVITRIVARSGESHQLDYVMREHGGVWKAVDVLADGSISRVAVQRSDFRHLLNEGGATALMASLQRKTRDLSHG